MPLHDSRKPAGACPVSPRQCASRSAPPHTLKGVGEYIALRPDDVRAILLEVIAEMAEGGPGPNIQAGRALSRAADRLGIRTDHVLEQALLTQFHELFRTGYLAWGFNLSNPNPPFFHLTDQGRKTLAQLSGDPGNPAGYLRRIRVNREYRRQEIPAEGDLVKQFSLADVKIQNTERCFGSDLFA